jgi:hypothetical protein
VALALVWARVGPPHCARREARWNKKENEQRPRPARPSELTHNLSLFFTGTRTPARSARHGARQTAMEPADPPSQ